VLMFRFVWLLNRSNIDRIGDLVVAHEMVVSMGTFDLIVLFV
jgi:hypothetical protein